MGYVSDWDEAMGIEHPEAYERAKHRNIINNALKTWKANTPRHEEIMALLDRRGRVLVETGYVPEMRYAEGFFGSLAKALDEYGKLSPKQVEAVLKCLDKDADRKAEWDAKREEKKASSQFVGEVGKRVELDLACEHIIEFNSAYGWMGIFLMRDADGNRVVYKGGKVLLGKNETGRFKASVKDHAVREGEKQTVITRPVKVEEV